MRLSAILFIISLMRILHLVPARRCAPWLEGRVAPLSTKGTTMAKEFDKDPSRKAVVRNLLNHYQILGSRQQEGDPNGGLWVCEKNPKERELFNSAATLAIHYGWGPAFDCMTILDDGGKNKTTYARAKNLYNDIRTFSDIVTGLGKRVTRSYGLEWQNMFSTELLTYNAPDIYRVCSLASSLAHRSNGRWSVSALLSNVSVPIAVKRWERGYFMEPISLKDRNHTEQVLFSIQRCKDKKQKSIENGTATISTWSGRPSWSHFSTRKFSENPAIAEALHRGEHEKELVEDSDTLSNLAILLLPAALALVPIGLFQDVSLSMTLVYTLATDVVSVLPVAIKGAELLWYGSNRHYATVSYLYGAETATDLAIAETWVSSCGMKASVGEKGIALLTTAVSAMVVGILLEFITRWQVAKIKKKHDPFYDFGAADKDPMYENGGLLWYLNRKGK